MRELAPDGAPAQDENAAGEFFHHQGVVGGQDGRTVELEARYAFGTRPRGYQDVLAAELFPSARTISVGDASLRNPKPRLYCLFQKKLDPPGHGVRNAGIARRLFVVEAERSTASPRASSSGTAV